MIYKPMGNSGVQVSVVSFGSMRWPSEQACFDIMQRGLDAGMNYVDTSTGYVGGQSEPWTGQAIAQRRSEIYVSSKTRFGQAPKADEVRPAIEKSLKTMGLDYFDFYQLWGLQTTEVLNEAMAKGGFCEGIAKARKDGLIRHGLGFTFHGPAETFRAAVDTGEFCAATVSYNLMNRRDEENIAYAASKGVGIVIMNPLAGGVLGLAGDENLAFLRGPSGQPSFGALRFLLANRGITTSIVGFRAVEEVDESVTALADFENLDAKLCSELARMMDAVQLLQGQFCTGCQYCKDCPSGVNVSKIMQAMRDFVRYGVAEDRLADWIWSKYAHEDPIAEMAKCTACRKCENTCPQHLQIVDAIERIKAVLAGQ
jgi:predicted aldo/keto reductase-like oxidoreductase